MTISPPSTVEFTNVHTRFGTNHVHRGLTFALAPGEVTTLLGPSGAGKTIILKLIIGLVQASEGIVRVMGEEVGELDAARLTALRVKTGMLFQGAALFDSLSVFENIAYGLRERGEKDEDKLSHIVQERLRMVGLPGIERKFPSQLSGGQRKRIGLARALATSPTVMLYDEPTTGLDPTSTRMIDELIVTFAREQKITSLVVTHDIQSARRISDRWMLLSGGVIAANGLVEDVAQNNSLVRDFISGSWKEAV